MTIRGIASDTTDTKRANDKYHQEICQYILYFDINIAVLFEASGQAAPSRQEPCNRALNRYVTMLPAMSVDFKHLHTHGMRWLYLKRTISEIITTVHDQYDFLFCSYVLVSIARRNISANLQASENVQYNGTGATRMTSGLR